MEGVVGVGPAAEHLARMVRALREAKRWSRDRLSAEVAAAGQPINANGIWKLEQLPPTRRTTVDEVVCLARALRVTPHELLGWGNPDLLAIADRLSGAGQPIRAETSNERQRLAAFGEEGIRLVQNAARDDLVGQFREAGLLTDE